MPVTRPDINDLVGWLGLRSPVPATICVQLTEAITAALRVVESRIDMPACVDDDDESDDNYPPDVRTAILLVAARLNKRVGSPEGVSGFGELGVVRITQTDPDVINLLVPYWRWDGFA